MATVPIFYLIDTSGSMIGEKIKKINNVMRKTITNDLCALQDSEKEYVIKVGILTFDLDCRWVTNGLVSVKDFIWNDLYAHGLTSMGAAFSELNKRLHREEFLKSNLDERILNPIIILFTDGYPTDEVDTGLKELKQNKWFLHAFKYAIAPDGDTDPSILEAFTGSKEYVLELQNIDDICEKIITVSVSASSYSIASDKAGFSEEFEDNLESDLWV